jgi:hypothetical protein
MSDSYDGGGWIPSCNDGDITPMQLRALRAEAVAAGNQRLVAICDEALVGDLRSRVSCQEVIAQAHARHQAEHPPRTYPVPPWMRPKRGVEYGCGQAACRDCYEPLPAVARAQLAAQLRAWARQLQAQRLTGVVEGMIAVANDLERDAPEGETSEILRQRGLRL